MCETWSQLIGTERIGVLDRLALLVLVVCRRGRVVLEGQECVAHSRVGQEPGKELGVALGELYGEARRDTARRPAARRRVSATCGGLDTGRCRAETDDAEVRKHSLADGSGRTLLLTCGAEDGHAHRRDDGDVVADTDVARDSLLLTSRDRHGDIALGEREVRRRRAGGHQVHIPGQHVGRDHRALADVDL